MGAEAAPTQVAIEGTTRRFSRRAPNVGVEAAPTQVAIAGMCLVGHGKVTFLQFHIVCD